jgi:hypothetical protein
MTFTVGEEVLYEEERFVVSQITTDQPPRYRLIMTSKQGARFVWARYEELSKIAHYTTPYDDTARY